MQHIRDKPGPGAMIDFTHPLARGLVGYWVMNETGQRVFDISPYKNHGALSGFDSPPKRGTYGIIFDGVKDYVDAGNQIRLRPILPVTVAAWINIGSLGTEKPVFEASDNPAAHSGFNIRIDSTNKFTAGYGDNGGSTSGNRRNKAGTTILNANIWYHVAGVIRGATDMSIYVNGIDDGGAYSGTGGAMVYSSSNSKIGSRSTTNTWFKGFIGELRIWNRALFKSDIKQLYQHPFDMFI